MSTSFAIFCIHICLIQYAISQRVNGPPMGNNGLQYGPNVGPSAAIQGPVQLNGVMNGPGIASMGPLVSNQALGTYTQSMPNCQAFGAMPNQAFSGTGIPNQAFASAGIQKQTFNAAGKSSQFYGTGSQNPVYGGAGNGDVAVNGELPVSGMTSVTGNVPMTGKVAFNGNVPCGGTVTITGSCTSCGFNAPIAQIQTPAYGNKPYGY